MKKSLKEFIDIWKRKEEVIGILLCGSYAIGMESKHSDVDIRVILNENMDNSYKGLLDIGGYSFSYIARTSAVIKEKFNSDFFNNSKIEARNFHFGKILYDETSELNKIKEVAKHYVESIFIKREKSEYELKSMMYSLYVRFLHLNEMNPKSPFFSYNYMLFMQLSITYYSRVLDFEFINSTKIEKVLMDENYAKAFTLEPFPDKEFINYWIEGLSIANQDKKRVEKLYNYLREKIFNLDERKFEMFWKN